MKRQICGALAGFFVLVAGSTHATRWVQEGFDYPMGEIDGTQTGGVGFAVGSVWTAVSSAGLVTNGLAYSGLATAGAQALRAKPSGSSRHQRSLAASLGGSTFYISLLINTYGGETERFGVELRPNDGPLFGRVSGGWGMFAGYNGALGISNTEGGYKTWTGVTNAADSATHLFVVKIDYEANAIKIYVDPLPDSTEPEPSATLTTGGNWTVNLNSDAWNALGLWINPANMCADELRVGTAWCDVMPATVIPPIVREGFNYPAGSLDGSQSNGFGFAAPSHWGTNANYGGIASGLAYSNFVTAGNGAFQTLGYQGHERAVTTTYGASTFYMSMLVNARGHETRRCGFEVRNGDGPLFGRVSGGWGMFSGWNGGMGISCSDGDFQVWTGVSNTADSATHLIVVKADYQANAIKLFVDPAVSGVEPQPSATLVTGDKWTVNLDGDKWTGIRIFHEIGDMAVDELRIGKTWGSVVPALRCVWTQTAGGTHHWVSTNCWEGGSVPSPVAGCTVDFGSADLGGDIALSLDATRTAAFWRFGDASGDQTWTVNAGDTNVALILDGDPAAIQVDRGTTTIHAPIGGTNGIVKTGSGTLVIDGTNRYAGATTVDSGTLTLAACGTLPAAGDIALAGGTLALAESVTNEAGALTVTADSALALGDGSGSLTFSGDTPACVWAGHLTITGTLMRSGTGALRFYPDGLSPGQIRLISYNGEAVHLDGNGYLHPGAQGTLIKIN